MAIVVPQQFMQLWGSDGIIMNLLDAIFPGSKAWVTLFVLFITVALVGVFINSIKQPIENMRTIIGAMLVLGGFSLLLFGNVAVLVVFEALLTISWVILHKTYEHREVLSGVAQSILGRVSPEEVQTFNQERRAEQPTGHNPHESQAETARLQRDMATLLEFMRAQQAARIEESRTAASGATNESNALDQADATLDQLDLTTRHFTDTVNRMESGPGVDMATQQGLKAYIQTLQQFATQLIRPELAAARLYFQKIETLSAEAVEESEIENSAEKLIPLIKQLAKELEKDLIKNTITTLRNELNSQRKALAAAKSGTPEERAQISERMTLTQQTISSIQTIEQRLTVTIKDVQKKLDSLTQTLKTIDKGTPDKDRTAINKSAEALTQAIETVEKGYETFEAELTRLSSAPESAAQLLVELNKAVNDLFSPYLKLRTSLIDVTQRTTPLLEAEQKLTILNQQATAQIVELKNQLNIIMTGIEHINKAAKDIINAPDIGSKAGELASALILEEEKLGRDLTTEEVNQINDALDKNRTLLKQEQEKLARAKEHLQQVSSNISNAFKKVNTQQMKILSKTKDELDAQAKEMGKVRNAA